MNNEIKFDHFENINELLEHIDLWYEEEDIYYERWFGLNDLKKLKDYITNLQQINKNLTNSLNKKVEEGIKLQLENEKLKENKLRPDELVYLLNQELVRQYNDYKSRNEKAIEYIEDKFCFDELSLTKLVDILQGSDKE